MANFFLGFNWSIFICALFLMAFGVTIQGSVAPALLAPQIIFYLAGLGLFFLFSAIDYRIFSALRKHVYIGAVALLLATLILGAESRGAIRWISFFHFRLQFSEILKPFLLSSVASFLAMEDRTGRSDRADTIKYGLALLLGAVPIFLIFKQPDLGSAVVYGVGLLAVIFAAGGPFWLFAILGIGGAVLLPLLWRLLAVYQRARVITLFNPRFDPQGAGYNAMQALIAVGAGGLLGLGLGQGTQSQLSFLPEHHTDFVFAAIAEEFGFVGAGALLIIYFLLIFCLLRLASQSNDTLGKVLTVGAAVMILTQVFINVGMNLGIMPVTGITLPLVSYGGSSVIATMIMLGVTESVAKGSKDR